MRKLLAMTIVCIASVMVFSGCTTSKSMKDGTHKAEFSAPDDHGWTEYVEITVTNEKITDVIFDGTNADGDKKSADKGYEQAMKDAGFETWPSDFYTKLSKQLLDTQDIDKVDTVAGATMSSDSFRQLVKSIDLSKSDTTTKKVNRK